MTKHIQQVDIACKVQHECWVTEKYGVLFFKERLQSIYGVVQKDKTRPHQITIRSF